MPQPTSRPTSHTPSSSVPCDRSSVDPPEDAALGSPVNVAQTARDLSLPRRGKASAKAKMIDDRVRRLRLPVLRSRAGGSGPCATSRACASSTPTVSPTPAWPSDCTTPRRCRPIWPHTPLQLAIVRGRPGDPAPQTQALYGATYDFVREFPQGDTQTWRVYERR